LCAARPTLEEPEVIANVQARLERNDDPIKIVEDCQEGLRQVGERYERQEYYLSGLIMAGKIFRQAMEILTPVIEVRFSVLLTSSYDSMRETVHLIRRSTDRQIASTPIILGGNQLNEQVCDYVGANDWVADAMTGVRLCQRLINQHA
jgi:methanogenic corrinoid protein MtbC1